MRAAPADDPRASTCPREPFLRLIEANRHGPARSRSTRRGHDAEGGTACTRPTRSGGSSSACSRSPATSELVAASDDVCTGLQLVNFLQDVPRDLALGRIYLPAEDRRRFDVTVLDAPNEPLTRLLRFEAGPGARPARPAGGCCASGSAGASAARSGSSPAAASPRSTSSRTPAWDIFTQRPRPSRAPARTRGAAAVSVERGVRGGRAPHPRPCAELRLRDHGAAEAEAARDRGDLRVRPRGRRRRRRRRCRPRRSGRASRRCTAASTSRPATRRCGSRSPTRAGASRSRRRRCTTSSTAA